jgi:hypothetical protein
MIIELSFRQDQLGPVWAGEVVHYILAAANYLFLQGNTTENMT